MVEHAWCLETVELGYRNVSLSGHPVLPSLSLSVSCCPSLDSSSKVKKGRDSVVIGQVKNNTILTALLK